MKPFPSTSAYLHSHSSLNHFLAFLEARKSLVSIKTNIKNVSRRLPKFRLPQPYYYIQDTTPLSTHNKARRTDCNPVDESRHWWASQCMSRGMLLKIGAQHYVCTGRSPAIVHVPCRHLEWADSYIGSHKLNRGLTLVEGSGAHRFALLLPWPFASGNNR